MIELAYIAAPDRDPILCYRYIAWGNSQWSEWQPVKRVTVADDEYNFLNERK